MKILGHEDTPSDSKVQQRDEQGSMTCKDRLVTHSQDGGFITRLPKMQGMALTLRRMLALVLAMASLINLSVAASMIDSLPVCSKMPNGNSPNLLLQVYLFHE